ncbi:hypothetical protein LINPERHAP1_LOCUS11685 [Linum perenne]
MSNLAPLSSFFLLSSLNKTHHFYSYQRRRRSNLNLRRNMSSSSKVGVEMGNPFLRISGSFFFFFRETPKTGCEETRLVPFRA